MSEPAGSIREPDVAADERYMRRALELAARGLNSTDPNPRVGCVLVRADRIVGEGWHERAGGPHAEVQALQAAGEAAVGATAYVTLEPCAHTGRTPPCASALIAARIARVVYGAGDPNPLVNGAGAAALRAAGLAVSEHVLAAESQALNPGFFKRMRTGLPWVRVKLAASLDGRTALASGESRWITGEAARADVQRYRARSSVVLSGAGTIIADDPSLDVRLPGTERQPLRVVLDSSLRVSPEARVFARAGESGAAHAMLFTSSTDTQRRAAFERRGIRVQNVPAAPGGGGLALEPVLRSLGQLQANEVWIEAGAKLAGAWLAAGLADELIVYVAPMLLGPTARPLLALEPIEQLALAPRLRFSECSRVGEDLRLIACPVGRGE
jgi:diaminohydroxyphosphoribosylaminopyrimidine deaminase/5-amino-6-(5-phosphoribosylamino)uracil reductase